MYVHPLYTPKHQPALCDDDAFGSGLSAGNHGFGKGGLSLTGGGEPCPPRQRTRGFHARRPELFGPQVLLGSSLGNRSAAVQRYGIGRLESRTIEPSAARQSCGGGQALARR